MKTNQQRLQSLDVLRGLTVAGMILVNAGWGETFAPLRHSEWNGLTPCDLVFPFFLFMMGVSTYLSLSKYGFRWSAAAGRKILKRTVLIFLIGLAINWLALAVNGDLGLSHVRLWAVLQRIAVCYGLASVFALSADHRWTLPTVALLLAAYAVLLLTGNGYANDETNLLARTDIALFGRDHLYRWNPVDPEGLLGTLSALGHTLIGFYCGRLIKQHESLSGKLIALFTTGTVLLVGGYLLSYGLPVNKTVWSPSYVLVSCGLAALLLALIMHLLDSPRTTAAATPGAPAGQPGRPAPLTLACLVFGTNPLFLYVMSEVLAIVLGRLGISQLWYDGVRTVLPNPYWASLGFASTYTLLLFVLGYALYRRRIFIKL